MCSKAFSDIDEKHGAESEVLSWVLGIYTVGLFCNSLGLFCGIMLKATRLLPAGSQTDRHNRNGRRAITMPSKHSQKAKRSIPSRKKHPNESRLDSSLYTVEGYVSWREKLQKASKLKRKRKRN